MHQRNCLQISYIICQFGVLEQIDVIINNFHFKRLCAVSISLLLHNLKIKMYFMLSLTNLHLKLDNMLCIVNIEEHN